MLRKRNGRSKVLRNGDNFVIRIPGASVTPFVPASKSASTCKFLAVANNKHPSHSVGKRGEGGGGGAGRRRRSFARAGGERGSEHPFPGIRTRDSR